MRHYQTYEYYSHAGPGFGSNKKGNSERVEIGSKEKNSQKTKRETRGKK